MTARRTRQLAAIEDVVRAARDHPTAEEVCRRVRSVLPRISLGTVYRNLQKLAARHAILVLQLSDRVARYDGMVAEHDHFLCDHCGRVTDLMRGHSPLSDCSGLKSVGYSVRAHTVTIYGVCAECTDSVSASS